METRRSWTWRRRVPSIFSRNCSRWTEELPPLHRHQRNRPKHQQRLPYRKQALHQHPHRRVIYVCMYFTPYRLFSLLQGAVKVLHYLSGPSSWNGSFQRLSSYGRFIKESYHGANLLPGRKIVRIVLQCHGYAIRYHETLDTKKIASFLQYP